MDMSYGDPAMSSMFFNKIMSNGGGGESDALADFLRSFKESQDSLKSPTTLKKSYV